MQGSNVQLIVQDLKNLLNTHSEVDLKEKLLTVTAKFSKAGVFISFKGTNEYHIVDLGRQFALTPTKNSVNYPDLAREIHKISKRIYRKDVGYEDLTLQATCELRRLFATIAVTL